MGINPPESCWKIGMRYFPKHLKTVRSFSPKRQLFFFFYYVPPSPSLLSFLLSPEKSLQMKSSRPCAFTITYYPEYSYSCKQWQDKQV